MDAGATRRSYDRAALAYAERFDHELDGKPLDRALLAMVVERAGGGIVADLGSGPGHVAAHLRGLGASAVAVDLAPGMATLARHRHGIPAAAGSLTALPLASASVAAAVAFYCFIHLDETAMAAAASEVRRVLRPGGVVLVSVHTGDEVRHVDELLGTPVDLDFRFVPVTVLRAALEDAGFAVEGVLERRGDPAVEAETQRAYVLAGRSRG